MHVGSNVVVNKTIECNGKKFDYQIQGVVEEVDDNYIKVGYESGFSIWEEKKDVKVIINKWTDNDRVNLLFFRECWKLRWKTIATLMNRTVSSCTGQYYNLEYYLNPKNPCVGKYDYLWERVRALHAEFSG